MELLTAQEVMHMLKIKSPTTLIKMERRKEIDVTLRIGNRKRYRLIDIQRYINRRKGK